MGLDWNIVAESRQGSFWRMCSLLGAYGEVRQTGLFNVVISRAPNPRHIPQRLLEDLAGQPDELFKTFLRLAPAEMVFTLNDASDVHKRVSDAASQWSEELNGQTLGVQIHRTPSIATKSSGDRWLQAVTDSVFESFHSSMSITPYIPGDEVPDSVLIVELIGDRAGMSLWTREEAERFPLLVRA